MLLRGLGSIGPLAFQVASSSECLFGVFIAALVNHGRDSQAFFEVSFSFLSEMVFTVV